MYKILLFLFLLVGLIFPQSEVFAQSTDQCRNQAINSDRDAPLVDSKDQCPANTICTKQILVLTSFKYRCHSDPNAAPAAAAAQQPQAPAAAPAGAAAPAAAAVPAAPAATPCTDPKTCTSGKGLRCGGGEGILTAIGCVPTKPQALVEGLLKYGTVAAGAIAFLLMILGALQMITAEGNPESIKHAQERFYSAIIGLLLIIFSVLLMQVIGVDLLGLPGFAR